MLPKKFWVRITYGVLLRRLGPTSLPSDDDLVDREDRPRRLRRELNSPLLRHKEIKNLLIRGIERTRVVGVLKGVSSTTKTHGKKRPYVYIHTSVPVVPLVVRGV